ncbi:MAG: hypothetical protein JWM91_1366 [Rhodospirillales bacterium]|nr:hypothetical protein [Rhodospirillales bacterium]
MSSLGQLPHLSSELLERRLDFSAQRLPENFAMFGLSRTSVSGSTPLKFTDQIVIKVANLQIS